MKIAIIGAGGVRTPMIVEMILERRARLGLSELALMDIDGQHLELIGQLTASIEHSAAAQLKISRTTDPIQALTGADYVITTFRVGGIESRAVDERVALNHGLLGQETTGAGGFALGMRSIPVILDYVHLMEKACPDAWLINFANPAGMLAEAVIRNTGWTRVVGICDAPASMHLVISAVLGASPEEVYLDYFGLNHLGWIKRVIYHDQDELPRLLERVKSAGIVPGLPFESGLILRLGMIPNEYLFYYYYSIQAVRNILDAKECRGEQIAKLNRQFWKELSEKSGTRDLQGMQSVYQHYHTSRSETYMVTETGKPQTAPGIDSQLLESIPSIGYAGVALNLIEALSGARPSVQVINIPNHSAIEGIGDLDVVEIPASITRNHIAPLPVGKIPDHCLGLIMQVKSYEKLTIEAAVEHSYEKALLALTLHPLIRDSIAARSILDDYIAGHESTIPTLS